MDRESTIMWPIHWSLFSSGHRVMPDVAVFLREAVHRDYFVVIPGTERDAPESHEKFTPVNRVVDVCCEKTGTIGMGYLIREVSEDIIDRELKRKAQRLMSTSGSVPYMSEEPQQKQPRQKIKKPAHLASRRPRKLQADERAWLSSADLPQLESHDDGFLTDNQRSKHKTYTDYPVWASYGVEDPGDLATSPATAALSAKAKRAVKNLKKMPGTMGDYLVTIRLEDEKLTEDQKTTIHAISRIHGDLQELCKEL